MMIRASEPPMKFMRSGLCDCFLKEIDICCGLLQNVCDNGLRSSGLNVSTFYIEPNTEPHVNRNSTFDHVRTVSRCARPAGHHPAGARRSRRPRVVNDR